MLTLHKNSAKNVNKKWSLLLRGGEVLLAKVFLDQNYFWSSDVFETLFESKVVCCVDIKNV